MADQGVQNSSVIQAAMEGAKPVLDESIKSANKALEGIVDKLLEVFGNFENNDSYDIVEKEENSESTTVVDYYNEFLTALSAAGMLNDENTNKVYAIFYLYIRHIIFKLNYVKELIKESSDNSQKFDDPEFIKKIDSYIDKVNNYFGDNGKIKDKDTEDNYTLYNNALGLVKNFKIFDTAPTAATPQSFN
jgi:hypothetical protein